MARNQPAVFEESPAVRPHPQEERFRGQLPKGANVRGQPGRVRGFKVSWPRQVDTVTRRSTASQWTRTQYSIPVRHVCQCRFRLLMYSTVAVSFVRCAFEVLFLAVLAFTALDCRAAFFLRAKPR